MANNHPHTADDVLGYISAVPGGANGFPAASTRRSHKALGRGHYSAFNLATASALHVQRLIDRGDAEAVGPLRTIKLRDENLAHRTSSAPFAPTASVTDPAPEHRSTVMPSPRR